mmetsp:Transcript_9440/g.21316  ORF Transcript_9440/g.21316 Transcript_9440/m.21316 type:complete len:115 (-) Transcript_9440:416-760(-)
MREFLKIGWNTTFPTFPVSAAQQKGASAIVLRSSTLISRRHGPECAAIAFHAFAAAHPSCMPRCRAGVVASLIVVHALAKLFSELPATALTAERASVAGRRVTAVVRAPCLLGL